MRFSEARFLFLLYVLIKNFLGTTKFWGAQTILVALPSNCPPWRRAWF